MNSPYSSLVEVKYEAELLGTAGSIRKYKDWFESDEIFIAHADNLSIFDFKSFRKKFNNRPLDSIGTMMTFKSDNPKNCGILSLDDNGGIKSYWEKDQNAHGNLANAAVYFVDQEFLSIIEHLPGNDLSKNIIPEIFEKFNVFHNEIYHVDVGDIKSFALAQVQYNQQLGKL
jgi:mannose-1-phosphate guanylyltransferase